MEDRRDRVGYVTGAAHLDPEDLTDAAVGAVSGDEIAGKRLLLRPVHGVADGRPHAVRGDLDVDELRTEPDLAGAHRAQVP